MPAEIKNGNHPAVNRVLVTGGAGVAGSAGLRRLVERGLGWRASHRFEAGLAETLDWFIANEWWWRPIRGGKYGGERLGSAA